MKTMTRDVVRAVLFAAFTAVLGLAQQAAPEKHVKDVRAEQPQKFIAASPLCQHVKLGVSGYIHPLEVDSATLETDLYSLMRNSDEVILASNFTDEMDAIAPSGEDAVEYYDIKVLRTFKGSHKVGDQVTYSLPRGGVYCGPKPLQGSASNSSATTATGGSDWGKIPLHGPYVLFLREARGEETQLTPGLRLAGGDGLQGMFALRDHYNNRTDKAAYTDCLDALPGGAAKCIAELEASQEMVRIPYNLDPMKAKYDTIPVSSFLKEVQSIADSQGSAGSASAAK
jgi:hypothetical protein